MTAIAIIRQLMMDIPGNLDSFVSATHTIGLDKNQAARSVGCPNHPSLIVFGQPGN